MADSSDQATLETSAQTALEPSDAELVPLAASGDEVAFEKLFLRHRRRVSLIAGRFFRRREQIEEIVQESFAKAYFALADFSNQQEASIAAWLARISFNVCYDELRRQKRKPESTMSEVSEEESTWLKGQLRVGGAEGDIESALVARDLATKLLSRLSAEDRLLLIMMDVEGLSVAEIANLTKWSISKVKVRAHRARASLRRVLARFL